MSVTTIEELHKIRKELIDVHEKNGFTNGLHALLTDLYPDTAHFLYELLQNAEDMNANVVRFFLREDGIDFEHDGNKRAFNIQDIDAITNIGQNPQKKDDPTSIGKFGVGFKSVFAYTSTPIIHSGPYHFKIENYFLPETQGVPEVNTIDNEGKEWTKFSFPFNNSKKPANVAYRECLNGLELLDSSSLLFLRNIKKIKYKLSSGENGYIRRNDNIDDHKHHVILETRGLTKRKDKTRWLRFERLVKIKDDQGNLKNLSIAVAFRLQFDVNSSRYKIVPVTERGKIFIYFPAEKEYSGFRFYINAPFASTVARDSIRACPENAQLIKEISNLIVDSLSEIKKQGLMNHSFFEVLPNKNDKLGGFYYNIIFDDICKAFRKNAYLPTNDGGYVSAEKALLDINSYSKVFSNKDVSALFNIKKMWIANAVKDSNADNFICSLGIQELSIDDILKIFLSMNRENTTQYLSIQSIGWLNKFYIICKYICKYETQQSIDCMKQTAIIRSSEGGMFKPSEIYILPEGVKLITETTPIVNPLIEKSLINILGVREYGPKIEIERALKKYEHGFEVTDQYYSDLLAFAKYKREYGDIDFSTSKIFLTPSEEDNMLNIVSASSLFLGEAYGNKVGQTLAEVYGKRLLWNGYAAHYGKKDLPLFVDFAISCGVSKGLIIQERSATQNPFFDSALYNYHNHARKSGYGIDFDYTIPYLEGLLRKNEFQISKLIWNTLERYGKTSGGQRYAVAKYSPNASAETKSCDSTLIYYLKHYAWVPSKNGNFLKPEDISLADLHEEFSYNSKNKLLVALEIGSAETKVRQEQKQKERIADQKAREAGGRFVSEEEYKFMQKIVQEWKSKQKLTQKSEPMSGQELLKKQSNTSCGQRKRPTDNGVSYDTTNIEEAFHNAKQTKTIQKKLTGRIEEATKEERKHLEDWYHGRCQMCGTVIIKRNHSPHFVAKNIINTQDLTQSVRQTTPLAWNSWCLCPNCAAKYDYCSRNLDDFFEQIVKIQAISGGQQQVILTIGLENRRQEVRYTPEHFLALKKAIELIDEDVSKTRKKPDLP